MDTQPRRRNRAACAFEPVHLGIRLGSRYHTGIIYQVADTLSRILTETAESTLLDDKIPAILIADDAEKDAGFVCQSFTCEEEKSLEPALSLIAALLKL